MDIENLTFLFKICYNSTLERKNTNFLKCQVTKMRHEYINFRMTHTILPVSHTGNVCGDAVRPLFTENPVYAYQVNNGSPLTPPPPLYMR